MTKLFFKEAHKQLELDMRALELLHKINCVKDLRRAQEVVEHYKMLYSHLEMEVDTGAFIVYGIYLDEKALASLKNLQQRFLNEIKSLIVFNPVVPIKEVLKEVPVGIFKVPPKMVLFQKA